MASDRAFFAVSALLFAACVTVTVVEATSMSAMDGMPMPGGWVMSMMWMRMGGETRLEAAGSFLAMWTVMMAAMMLPVLVPMLWDYRKAVSKAGAPSIGLRTMLAALGYFAVWSASGLAVFPLGVATAETSMREPTLSPWVPIMAGGTVLIAGVLQLTPWKSHSLACCRKTLVPADPAGALWHGLRLGVLCVRCCANLMAILLALGIMDLSAMALVTAGITLERYVPKTARILGTIAIGAGLFLIARTL